MNIHCCAAAVSETTKINSIINSINWITELFSPSGRVRARCLFVYFQSSKKKNTCILSEPRDVEIYFWKRITKLCTRVLKWFKPVIAIVVAKFNGPHSIFTIELMCGAFMSQIKHKPNLVLSIQLHIIFMHSDETELLCCMYIFFWFTVFKIIITVYTSHSNNISIIDAIKFYIVFVYKQSRIEKKHFFIRILGKSYNIIHDVHTKIDPRSRNEC